MVIYRTTHTPSGKMYIGKDINNNDSYFGSGAEIKKIIKKEGKVNFTKEILETVPSKELLPEREIYWLEKYDVENNPNYLNKTNKAFGNSGLTEETKKKISLALKGKVETPSTKAKKSNSLKKYWDNVSLEERKIRGIKSKEARNKISGYSVSDETRAKMTIANQRPRPNSWKKVIQYDLDNNIIKEYESANQAKHQSGIEIKNALTGRAKTAGGFIWRYKE